MIETVTITLERYEELKSKYEPDLEKDERISQLTERLTREYKEHNDLEKKYNDLEKRYNTLGDTYLELLKVRDAFVMVVLGKHFMGSLFETYPHKHYSNYFSDIDLLQKLGINEEEMLVFINQKRKELSTVVTDGE